jgi:hypothetical protein
MTTPTQERPVVVTTAHRGVFFGYTAEDPRSTVITLKRCRMCVYWSAAVRGVLGLAVSGPLPDCRISPAPPQVTLQEVTAVLECSPEAARAWEAALWQS